MTSPHNTSGFILWQVFLSWRKNIENTLKNHDLTYVQYVILSGLAWIEDNNYNVNQKELAQFCGTDLTVTSQALRALEKKDWVKREADKKDERVKNPTTTVDGRKILEKTKDLVRTVDDDFFSLSENKENLLKNLSELMLKVIR